MTAHLLLVSLGPVQDFIAQARRTRDLWYGSHLLSEIARCGARSLIDQNASLIFPALDAGDLELDTCFAPLRPNTGQPPLNIANKLLAEIPAGVEPSEVARAVRKEIRRFWRKDIAAPVKAAQKGLLAQGRNADDVWNEQVSTLLEFTAAWAPLEDYTETREELERAVAARKNLRDFRPWKQFRGGVPKSSLDGARETVLLPPNQRSSGLVRIGDAEQLDAVGLVKRSGGDPYQFVPIVNVALGSWLKLVADEDSDELAKVREACKFLEVSPVRRPDLPCARPFPFDASVFLPNRWKPLFDEQGLGGDPEDWGATHIRPLLDRFSLPYPYVTCLVADGDNMGRAIGALDTAAAHRTFSHELAGFAREARNIVEQDHLGSMVYAGGDDVLAFLPVPEALACAEALRRGFKKVMDGACGSIPEHERPTLSVGLGIGHVMEAMGDLLALGREAERIAKGAEFRSERRDRNALSIIVDKRSGGRRTWRARWDEWDGDPVGRLHRDVSMLEAQLSWRKVYEVADTLRRLPDPAATSEDGWARVLALEVRQSISRAHAGNGGVEPGTLGLELDVSTGYSALHAHVSAWVEGLLIAKTFASAVPHIRSRAAEAAV